MGTVWAYEYWRRYQVSQGKTYREAMQFNRELTRLLHQPAPRGLIPA